MNDDTFDPVDAAALDQFLLECEPPTPPTAALSLAMASDLSPKVFLHSEVAQPPSHPPKQVKGALMLDEADKQAILAALDDNNDSPDQKGSLICSDFYLQQQQCFDERSLVSPSNTSQSAEEQARKLKLQRAKATKRRNRHRQRVNEEWAMLKLQNKMLGDKLEQLTNSRLTDGVADLKWQVLASKELEARLQAEAQQRQVRMVIERRFNAMQKLQEVLHMHEDKKTVKDNWGSDDFALYKNFHYEITAAYAQTDAILNASGLDGAVPSNTSFYKPVRSRDELRNLDFFESTSAFTIPFSYPKPAVAMFDSMREVHRLHPERHLYEVGDDISNTIAVKFGTVYHCNAGKVVPLALIIVMRRFVEYHRTVLVWRCLIQGDGEFIGTFLDSTGWCVLRPTSSGGIASTDVRTCIRLVPTQMSLTKTIEADDTGSIQDAEVFTEAVVRSSQQDKLKLTYIMEKMLLESK